MLSTCLLKFLKYLGWSSGFLNCFPLNLHVKAFNGKSRFTRERILGLLSPIFIRGARNFLSTALGVLWGASAADRAAPTPRLHLPLDPAFLPAFPTAAAKNNGGTRLWGRGSGVCPGQDGGRDRPGTGLRSAGLGRLRFLPHSQTPRLSQKFSRNACPCSSPGTGEAGGRADGALLRFNREGFPLKLVIPEGTKT